ncbi:hypothetical protein CHUAL_007861 [Chamberlinius hualienensis]
MNHHRKSENSGETLMFIENVKFRPLLYDRSAPDFKNEHQKSKAWIDIARDMKRKGNERLLEKWSHDKWRRLKLTYGQHRRKLRKIAPDGKDYLQIQNKCPWPYFNVMTFFDDHIPIRNLKNLPGSSASANISNVTNDFEDDNDDAGSVMTNASMYSRVSNYESPLRGDALYHFGQFISQEMRTIPKQQRLSLQKEMIHLLFEVKYETENLS